MRFNEIKDEMNEAKLIRGREMTLLSKDSTGTSKHYYNISINKQK